MSLYPLAYIEPVFRPPSEWRSLILQVTNGCSWNRCAFCDMYQQPQKKFKPRSLEAIQQDLEKVFQSNMPVRRIFLADGDAMVLSMRRLREILQLIRRYFPDVQRVSSYCLPSNVKNKTVDELAELQHWGLSLVYIGCESGDDTVLQAIDKGESYQSQLQACDKLKQAGIKRSVMILNGLGGQQYWRQHAQNSAKLINQVQPEYLSTLVTSLPLGDARMQSAYQQQFKPLNQRQLFEEMRLFIQELRLENSIFRSDHASNYLALKGTLGKDKQKFLAMLDCAIQDPELMPLRQEWQRGL